MKRLLFIMILFIPCLSWGQNWNAVDYQKWQDQDTTNKFMKRIGGAMANYLSDSGWYPIANDFVVDGDTIFKAHDAILKTTVRPNGISAVSVIYGGNTYTVSQKPIKLVWLNTDTWNWIDIFESGSWPTPSVDSNIVSWVNVFPAVDYRVRKLNAQVEHGIFFKKAFLDSAVVLYDQRADSLDIALANVMEYTLSANIENADSGIGNVDNRVLKQLGKYFFKLGDSRLYFPGLDTLQTVKVHHRWIKQVNKIYMLEYVMMRRVKQVHEAYPDATVWHNESTIIEGTTDVEDAGMKSGGNANRNYGGSLTLSLWKPEGGYNALVRCQNVASNLGEEATISACSLFVYVSATVTDGDVGVYRVFKPWVEGDEDGINDDDGDVTWNDWASDANQWTTAGCGSADDGGSDNSGDGTGADRKATYEDGVTLTWEDDGVWKAFDMSTTLAQGWYDGTINENGVFIQAYSGVDFNASLYSTERSSNQPYWTFYFTTGEPEPSGINARRRKILTGQ